MKQLLDESIEVTNNEKNRLTSNELYVLFKSTTKGKMLARYFVSSVGRLGIVRFKANVGYCFKGSKYKTMML